MDNRLLRRALWMLLALFVLAPPVATFFLQPPTDLLARALSSIPAPQTVEIRPRLFVAYGSLVAASTLSILYLYRGRTFVVYWIVSWSMLAASYTLNARGYADVRLGSVMIGLSELLTVWSAGLLLLSAREFAREGSQRWNGPLQAGAGSAMFFLAAPLVLPLPAVLYAGFAASAVLKGWASARFAKLGRTTPVVGAYMISTALGVMAALDTTGAVMSYRIDTVGSNALLAFNIVTSVFVALGMHLLVFEDMTEEIRRTNMALSAANDQIRHMAITDPLTGCYNRRFFDAIGRRELERHRRYNKPLTILFVDLDRFKHLNDRYGHDTGDLVLRTVGALLRRSVRGSDYVIRWGGDEFLLLLTCTVPEAKAKAEELKAAFTDERYAAGLPEETGLSIGIGEVSTTAETLNGAIRVADTAMYRDKVRRVSG
jgi:diguanylate cyclase (GGDEF)-like protein